MLHLDFPVMRYLNAWTVQTLFKQLSSAHYVLNIHFARVYIYITFLSNGSMTFPVHDIWWSIQPKNPDLFTIICKSIGFSTIISVLFLLSMRMIDVLPVTQDILMRSTMVSANQEVARSINTSRALVQYARWFMDFIFAFQKKKCQIFKAVKPSYNQWYVSIYICVCVRERETARESERERERDIYMYIYI